MARCTSEAVWQNRPSNYFLVYMEHLLGHIIGYFYVHVKPSREESRLAHAVATGGLGIYWSTCSGRESVPDLRAILHLHNREMCRVVAASL